MHQGGSVGSVAWRHAMELSAVHKVFVITRAVPPRSHPNIYPIIVRPSNWNWLRRYCHVPNEVAFIWSARRALKALCRREKIDLAWCHSHATTALAAAPLRSRFRFQVVMTTHGDIFDRPAGSYSPELVRFYKAVTPAAYRSADMVHVLSPYMADLAVNGGASRARVRVFPNGLDPGDIALLADTPRDASSFMPGGLLRLLYVGSLWKVKGVDVLLRAAADLLHGQSGERIPTILTVVGGGELHAELAALAASLGIGNDVVFRGAVPRTELASFYANADLVCVPSRSEAFSIVTIEAMMCGVPVVASRTGGLTMLVEDGLTGYLATPQDHLSFAAALRKAAVSPEHLAAFGRRGAAKVQSGFGWAQIGAKLEGLVEETLALAPSTRKTS
jgi:glycosyltransferase involved in cell wall biosynthesis